MEKNVFLVQRKFALGQSSLLRIDPAIVAIVEKINTIVKMCGLELNFTLEVLPKFWL